ncbi:dihydroxyacetone kinase, C-terminal domain [metagenome]|uniref:Dihydroxyacetone kinase, C-terminal domain n=1 Tax=metagenome TaxID=256318 RepID=A0A2P2BYW9_9ZZZZ
MGSVTVTQTVTLDQLVAWMAGFRDAVHRECTYLTELDSAIGDADHGTNLTRGMDAVMVALEAPPGTAQELLKSIGMTLVGSVGGASGPLYGTFFLRAAASVGAVDTVEPAGVVAMLRAGLEGIVARGKAELGDKTMYDALSPALDALAAAVESGDDLAAGLRSAAEAAASGRDATAPLLALKGRASYLGERSIGHIDPGAASATLLLESLADAAG